MDILRMRVMEFMAYHRGKAKAAPRRYLHAYLKRFDPTLTDRKMRVGYEDVPLASCRRGLFIPITPEEALEYKALCKRKAKKYFLKYRTLVAYYPELRVENNRSLFDGART
jgi:hypothetical protein